MVAGPIAAGPEAEVALGPRGLNLAVEEGLGSTASMEAVSEAVLGSNPAVAAVLSSKEAVVVPMTVANPEVPVAAEPMEAESLELAAPKAAVPGLSVGAAVPTGAAAETPCSAEAMGLEAAASAPEAGPSLDASAACSAAVG